MPSPKSGTAGTAVTPADPDKAVEADNADPGAVDQTQASPIQKKAGKYGSVKVKPFKPPKTKADNKKKPSWIEIEMVDEKKQPVAGMAYRITLPDETVAEGTLDDKGFARVEGFESGACKVSFPDLDQDAWEDA
jgi:type VI secretion system secreted protein VgrG